MKKGCKIAITIVGVALVVVLLRGCVATSYLIPSSGMENSLYQGNTGVSEHLVKSEEFFVYRIKKKNQTSKRNQS